MRTKTPSASWPRPRTDSGLQLKPSSLLWGCDAVLLPGKLPLWLFFWLGALCTLPGCRGWEVFEDEAQVPEGKAFQLSVLDVQSCPLPTHLDPARVKILSYKVRLASGDERGVPANYFYASLLCTDGTRYLADYDGCSPLFSGPPASAGETREGFLNFPIPPSKTPEKIVYRPELFEGTDEGLQEIPLGPLEEDEREEAEQ